MIIDSSTMAGEYFSGADWEREKIDTEESLAGGGVVASAPIDHLYLSGSN
jgi:hypothetical protein